MRVQRRILPSVFRLPKPDLVSCTMSVSSSGVSRRFILSSLAALPALASASPFASARAQAADPLPSWNDGRTKKAILDFVADVTLEGSPHFVPVPERIATFDNDGTLWV